MSLADLIHRKRTAAPVATAIPAIFATHGREEVGIVARVATVAIAKAKDPDPVSGVVDPDVHQRWTVAIPGRDPFGFIVPQCRATLETLATIKNPPVIYARQANVTTGPQQVNNGVVTATRAREDDSKPNKQSEATHELLQDTRASRAAIGSEPSMATVGEIHRAEIGGG